MQNCRKAGEKGIFGVQDMQLNVGAIMHGAAFISEGLLLSGTLHDLPFAVLSASYILYDPAHNNK